MERVFSPYTLFYMTTKEQLISVFDSEEIKNILSEIIDAADTISKKTPTVGFHHKFYIPGWISFFQISMVESKMNTFEKATFYKEMNYIDFANWIIKSSNKLAELQVNALKSIDCIDDEDFQRQSQTIIAVLHAAAEAWYNSAPEVASMCNREYTKDTRISLAGIVFRALEENLKPLGCPQSSTQKEPSYEGPSFSDMGNQLLAIICNVTLFGIIMGIGSLIFG